MALVTQPGADANAELVRSDVVVLLREKRYEEALALLYRARAESPANLELQRGIDQVKEFLIGAYAKRLGGLDKVPQPISPRSRRSPDMVLISRYIDGMTTYGDLAEMCPLGRLRTLQVLIDMYPPATSTEPSSEAHGAQSGLRTAPSSETQPSPAEVAQDEGYDTNEAEGDDEPAPQTARSRSGWSSPPPPPEDADALAYREAFARGTAAFIQARFAEAIEAFEVCARLRPNDNGAQVMLRRARHDFASR